MNYSKEKTIRSIKPHKCANCGELIKKNELYVRWASFDDGTAFTNKMHPECLESLRDGENFEYSLYGGERPNLF